jgi:hypothetical protein
MSVLYPKGKEANDMESVTREEYIKLLDELHHVKDDVAQMIATRDFQAYHASAMLEIDYMNKVGKLENDIFEYQYYLERIRRKIEIIRDDPALAKDLSTVELQLDAEFADAEKELKERKRREDFLLVTEKFRYPDFTYTQSLTDYYVALVKKMHICFNEDATDEEMQIWQRVQSAYIKKDVEALKQLNIATAHYPEYVPSEDQPQELRDEIKKYRTYFHSISEEYENKKRQFPFTYEARLDDSAWLDSTSLSNSGVLEYLKRTYDDENDVLEALIAKNEK